MGLQTPRILILLCLTRFLPISFHLVVCGTIIIYFSGAEHWVLLLGAAEVSWQAKQVLSLTPFILFHFIFLPSLRSQRCATFSPTFAISSRAWCGRMVRGDAFCRTLGGIKRSCSTWQAWGAPCVFEKRLNDKKGINRCAYSLLISLLGGFSLGWSW